MVSCLAVVSSGCYSELISVLSSTPFLYPGLPHPPSLPPSPPPHIPPSLISWPPLSLPPSLLSRPPHSTALEATVAENIHQLEQDCYRLETMARKEPPTRRQEAKQSVVLFPAHTPPARVAYSIRAGEEWAVSFPVRTFPARIAYSIRAGEEWSGNETKQSVP